MACLLALTLSAGPVLAGKLEDFERSATEKSDDGGGERHDKHDHDLDLSDETAGEAVLLALLIAATLPAYGAGQSWARVTGSSLLVEEPPERRRAGEATIPFARADLGYQLVESDVGAWDLRGEVGFGPFAVQVRETHYDEDQPRDELDLVQAHALLRMTVTERMEIDFGLGAHVLDRGDTASGVSGTVPVLIHPWNFLGFEFRPAWAGAGGDVIEDYDLSVLAGWRFVSARVGYRWTQAGGSSLNGPIFGLAARW